MHSLKDGAYQEFRVARERCACAWELTHPFPDDAHPSQRATEPGDRYCLIVAMPWSEANQSPTPYRIRECRNCCSHGPVPIGVTAEELRQVLGDHVFIEL